MNPFDPFNLYPAWLRMMGMAFNNAADVVERTNDPAA